MRDEIRAQGVQRPTIFREAQLAGRARRDGSNVCPHQRREDRRLPAHGRVRQRADTAGDEATNPTPRRIRRGTEIDRDRLGRPTLARREDNLRTQPHGWIARDALQLLARIRSQRDTIGEQTTPARRTPAGALQDLSQAFDTDRLDDPGADQVAAQLV